jgi:hypothetical protein
MKLLDTTFLVHYWAGREAVAEYLEAHENDEFITTTLNVKEIAVGRELQGKLDPFEIRSKFGWLEVVPFRMEHSFVAGRMEAELRRNGRPNQDKINSLAADILIASVAKERDASVVTRNTEDFDLFDGVGVEAY